jgi:opacity protein-like surface antigen
MAFKKAVLLGLASVVTLGASLCSAADNLAVCNLQGKAGMYVGIDFGSNYNTELNIPKTGSILTNSGTKYTPWGWTAGGVFGYQFNNHLALQFGYMFYQKQRLTQTSSTQLVFYRYNMYMALKGMMPVFGPLTAYMLVGPAYSRSTTDAGTVISGIQKATKSIWTPMGAFGLSYEVYDDLSVNLQYMFILADMRSVQAGTTYNNATAIDANTQRITMGINYLFEM